MLLNSAPKLPFLQSNGLKGVFSLSAAGDFSPVRLSVDSWARITCVLLVAYHSVCILRGLQA